MSEAPEQNSDGIMDAATFRRLLQEIGRTRMPFGKYGPAAFPPDGLPLDELSLDYLQWFRGKGGFPKGRLGELMALVYEIKATGMGEVFGPARAARGGVTPKPRRPRVRKFLD